MPENCTKIDAGGVGAAHQVHLVQLFDSEESLAETVADFLAEGLLRSDTILVVMDEERWYSVAMRLSARGLPLDEALRFGHLTVCSAEATLKKFMRNGRPEPRLFAESVGQLVTRLGAFRRLRIYGEMVNVLAAQSEFAAAHELEELWNELGKRNEFTLFCGYSSVHFGDPRNADVLRRICASHTQVRSCSNDVLGSYLVREHASG
jgi:hypothetical protein